MAEQFNFEAWMKSNNEKAQELDLLRNNEANGISNPTVSTATTMFMPAVDFEETTIKAEDSSETTTIKAEDSMFSETTTIKAEDSMLSETTTFKAEDEDFYYDSRSFEFEVKEEEYEDNLGAIGETITYQPTVLSDEFPITGDDSEAVPTIDDFKDSEKSEEFPSENLSGLSALVFFLWSSGIMAIFAYVAVGSIVSLILVYIIIEVLPNLSIQQRLNMVRSVVFQAFMWILFPIRNTKVGRLIITYFENVQNDETELSDVVVENVKSQVPTAGRSGRKLHPKSLKPRLYPTLPTIDETSGEESDEPAVESEVDVAVDLVDGVDGVEVDKDDKVETTDVVDVETDHADSDDEADQLDNVSMWNSYRSLQDMYDVDNTDTESIVSEGDGLDPGQLLHLVDAAISNQNNVMKSLQNCLSNWDTHLQAPPLPSSASPAKEVRGHWLNHVQEDENMSTTSTEYLNIEDQVEAAENNKTPPVTNTDEKNTTKKKRLEVFLVKKKQGPGLKVYSQGKLARKKLGKSPVKPNKTTPKAKSPSHVRIRVGLRVRNPVNYKE